jgi:hypothetical protein
VKRTPRPSPASSTWTLSCSRVSRASMCSVPGLNLREHDVWRDFVNLCRAGCCYASRTRRAMTDERQVMSTRSAASMTAVVSVSVLAAVSMNAKLTPCRRVAPGIAPRGSHRSGRAELPHPARQVAGSLVQMLRGACGCGRGRRLRSDRNRCQANRLPDLRAREGAAPDAFGKGAIAHERVVVAGDAEVSIATPRPSPKGSGGGARTPLRAGLRSAPCSNAFRTSRAGVNGKSPSVRQRRHTVAGACMLIWPPTKTWSRSHWRKLPPEPRSPNASLPPKQCFAH